MLDILRPCWTSCCAKEKTVDVDSREASSRKTSILTYDCRMVWPLNNKMRNFL